MMKGVMMSATLSVTNVPAGGQTSPATGQSEPAHNVTEAGAQTVTSLVSAGKQAFTSPYTVTVKKIEPIPGSNQVRVTFFVTGEDDPAHDFTQTGNQVVAAFLNAGMHANVAGAGTATVQKIEAVEGGDDDSEDDSDENSDTDALSGLTASATPTSVQPTATPPTTPATTPATTPPATSPAPPSATPASSAPAQPAQQTPDANAADASEAEYEDRPPLHQRPPHVQ